ncbi:MAG: hypothetical protein JEZ14_13105 [Marinilabiliaceae bacterium]|nr:hypothetical protein [Marinilabiliaceae bacterium]
MKHWTEPNGIFIVNIPIEWQYRNSVIENIEEKSPYSFEPYEASLGCFQLSCYPLSERGINPNFPVQKNNSRIEWLESRKEDGEFDILLYHAQVDDMLCMVKYIYSTENRNDDRIEQQIEYAKKALDSFRIIPKTDRVLAANLNKHDNFLGSLLASSDLLENAYKNESHIELVVILSNQIDAFLRISIILHQQLEKQTNDIEVKYLFQGDNERGIIERKIYTKAHELKIIDDNTYKELNDLYNLRNRVIHRYIISFLKTRDIAKIAYDYTLLNEKIKLILRTYEEKQFGTGFGIYGRGYKKDDEFDETDYRRAYSMANDKHLLKKLKRKI